MAEQKPLSATEIGGKLTEILDGLLAAGDWENSLFLKTSASRLRELRDEAEILAQSKDHHAAVIKASYKIDATVPPGYVQVSIFLYQVDGSNLQSWLRVIKYLFEHNVSRAAYKNEAHAQEFVRSKTTELDRNGYVVVNVKENDFYQVDPAPLDPFGHELSTLKENAISPENIVKFVHANKKCYVLRDGELIYSSDLNL